MTEADITPTGSPEENPASVTGLPLRDLPGFTHRWVDADGIRLHAVEGGSPSVPTIVLLAGFPQNWWAWHKAMPRLAERFHVIAVDLPGQGHSDRPGRDWGSAPTPARRSTGGCGLSVRGASCSSPGGRFPRVRPVGSG